MSLSQASTLRDQIAILEKLTRFYQKLPGYEAQIRAALFVNWH